MNSLNRQVTPEFVPHEFRDIVAKFGESRFEEIETPIETRARLTLLVRATPAEAASLPDLYNQRIRHAEQRLQRLVEPVGRYLANAGISWSVAPSLLLGPAVWNSGSLGNVLIYGLGLTPHDPWNQVLMVDNPVASIDLEMPCYSKAVQEKFAEDIQRHYLPMAEEFTRLNELADQAGDDASIAQLSEHAVAIRRSLMKDMTEARAYIASQGMPAGSAKNY